MRKSLVGFVFLALCLSFSSMPAHAQTVITLDPGPVTSPCTTCFDFSVSEPNVTMTLPSPMSFAAITTGTLLIPTITTYTMSETSPIFFTDAGGGVYNVAPGSGAFLIDLSSGTFTLNGALTIQNLAQNLNNGTIDTSIVGNFDILGGTYCSEPGATCGLGVAYGKVAMTLNTSGPLTSSSVGQLNSATITDPPPGVTPEPASILLFGSGLLAIGGALRRRLLVSA